MVGEIRNQNIIIKKNCVARALYENVAESPDELAFCKGDLLTVLEQNTAGLEGWWLCALRGRQGICPGNRLRIVPGCYDNGSGIPGSAGVASLPLRPNSISHPQDKSKKVVTPRRVGDAFSYEGHPNQPQSLNYDIPRQTPARNDPEGNDRAIRLSRSSSLRYDVPRSVSRMSLEQYDSPRSPSSLEPSYDSPKPRPLYDAPKFPSFHEPHYNAPRPDAPDTPRSLIKGVRGGSATPCPPKFPVQAQSPVETVQQEYDVPRPSNPTDGGSVDRSSCLSRMSCNSRLSSSSSAASLAASESLSLSSVGDGSSNRSSLGAAHDVYDVPPEPRRYPVECKPSLPKRGKQESKANVSVDAVYDVPPQVCRDTSHLENRVRETSHSEAKPLNRMSSGSDSSEAELDNASHFLPLEVDSAIDYLHKLEQDALSACNKISSMKNTVLSFETIQTTVLKLKEAVAELLTFIEGACGNAVKVGEHKLAKRIKRLSNPVTAANVIVLDAHRKLQDPSYDPQSPDTLKGRDQLMNVFSVTTSLSENARHLVSVVQMNAHLIFKKRVTLRKEDEEKTPVQERPLPQIPGTNDVLDNRPWSSFENGHQKFEQFDYENLATQKTSDREILPRSFEQLIRLENDRRMSFENDNGDLSPQKTPTNLPSFKPVLRVDANDKQVLSFYGVQIHRHLENLNAAIESFLLTVENNQPPKIFIAHSKIVILNAHKLVFIGDTIHRNISNTEIRTRVLKCTNALCDAMKTTVISAKNAAFRFPSVAAVQTMVDAFVSVSQLSNNLKAAIS